MKKIRFFYGIVYTSVCLCGWGILVREALKVNAEAKVSTEETDTVKDDIDFAKENSGDKIRVLIMDSDYNTYFHPVVEVFWGGQAVTYTKDSPDLQTGSLRLDAGENGILVMSVLRQEGSPVYPGTLEIVKRPEGLLLINELPVEQYLEAVVPSEMPSDSPMEALKAQAICARTYAYKQMEEKRLEEYGANVDDSVNFQVYYNIFPRESVRQAVKETQNQVMVCGGELIEAYYFSTSCGVTSTDEVWGAAVPADYLKSVPCQFDSGQPYGRWETTVSWEILTQRAQELKGCKGALKDLQIVKQSQNHAVTGLRVITEEGSFDVEGEYQVRAFLSPKGCILTENDGTQTDGGKLLPSAYFSMEINPSENVYICGKGYGHGVGMSQMAACEMAENGDTCTEILNYFFKEIRLVSTETL